ncbi:hypothetical protein FGADI_7172 [Fusarium gaditjirri]|uniref:Uncharacterized protein n=1 Tax=Fusarium gaditjirri TaxID=282569 RepID=A0A8H4T615_9HYPO|nr:hypothetical protein FGADI_7172 [Fusarium gaditjirri]
MGDAAILTSGAAVGALPNGDHYADNGAAGSTTYCGGLSNNAAILTADIMIIPGFGGMRFEVVMASEESGARGAADATGIFVNNRNYALDGNGNRLSAVSPWLPQPLVIVPPNSVTSYPGSSPPYWMDVPLLPGGAKTVVVAICDAGDTEWDSALMIKVEACVDCNEPFRLAYVTTTATLTADDTPCTSTITASGTMPGMIEIGETTSTAEDTIMATTSKETTNITTAEETTTTTAKDTTVTALGTTTDVMETSTEASSSVTSEEPPNSTIITADTTSVERSDTITDSSTIVVESTTAPTSDTTTKPAPNSSNESTTSLETTIPISTDEVTLSLSSDLSSESATSKFSPYISKKPITPATGVAFKAAEVPVLIAKPAPIPDMTIIESLETSAIEETESSTDTISNPTEEASFSDGSDAISSTAQGTPSPATSTVATSSTVPSNLAAIGTFKFFGCAWDLQLAIPAASTRDPVMQQIPWTLLKLTNGRFDLPCPGDPGLFCGGVILTDPSPDSRLRRRDAPPGILITLDVFSQPLQRLLFNLSTSKSSILPTDKSTISGSPSSSIETFVGSVISLEPLVPVTKSQGAKPITPPFPTTVSYNAGNFTRTKAVAPITTTVTYNIIDPNNPSSLTITEHRTTLRPPPCHRCHYQKPPTVEMATIEVDCDRCGQSGENTIVLNIPAGAVVVAPTREYEAHETHSVQHYEFKLDNQGTQLKNSSPSAKGSLGQAEPSAVLWGGNGYPDAPKPTFHRRPAPAHTPVIAPDAPIAIVSGAAVKGD